MRRFPRIVKLAVAVAILVALLLALHSSIERWVRALGTLQGPEAQLLLWFVALSVVLSVAVSFAVWRTSRTSRNHGRYRRWRMRR